MIIDTHAHLNFSEFDHDREKLIKECLQEGYNIINIGTNKESSQKCIEIAENYPKGVFASVGLHPSNISSFLKEKDFFEKKEESFDYDYYKNLAKSSKVVAIGETGLDYWYKPKSKIKRKEFFEKQKYVFQEHLRLARELNLPIVIHCRSAFDDLFNILTEQKGVVHCFTGNKGEAKRLLSLGYYLGINGIIFKIDLDEAIKIIPLEKMLLETDCPYLSPPSFEQRNNPFSISLIIEKVSEIKGISKEEIVKITTQNAKKLFNI
jgi:TatD DNase family protein